MGERIGSAHFKMKANRHISTARHGTAQHRHGEGDIQKICIVISNLIPFLISLSLSEI
jgi:hypothetical protein